MAEMKSLTINGKRYDCFPVDVDSTLTTSGKPADAKATGEAIARINEDISDLKAGSGSTKVIAEEQELIFGETSGMLASAVTLVDQLVAGNTYKVVWGDEEFTCECYDKMEGGGVTLNGLALGNASLMMETMTNTGEPFFVGSSDGENFSVIKRADDPTTTIAIYGGEEMASKAYVQQYVGEVVEQVSSGVGAIVEQYVDAATARPTSIDLSQYESNGRIVETFADGTTKTTTVEFDGNGKPVKITDSAGNTTNLNW